MWQSFPAILFDYVLYILAKLGMQCRVATRLAFAIVLGAIFQFWEALILLKLLHNIFYSQMYQQEIDNTFITVQYDRKWCDYELFYKLKEPTERLSFPVISKTFYIV